MAPPKPKPRTELARAAAVASKWAFGTPGQSAKQQKAAEKNWDYIQQRLAETGKRPGVGSALSPEETRIGERWESKRAARPVVPRPVKGAKTYKPGDPEWSSDAKLSAAEIERAGKAFTGPKKGAGERILKELERQGFQKPTTNEQARAQARQLAKRLSASGRASVAAAMKNPLDVQGNADLLGPRAARTIAEAARQATPPPPPKSKWTGAVTSAADWVTPDTAQRYANKAGEATMGIAPGFTKAPLRNLKQITADIAMAVPVVAETIYNDFAGNTHLAIPRMAVEMIRGWGEGIEAATPLPKDLRKTLEDVAHGRWDELSQDAKEDFHRMAEEWQQRPFTAALNIWPGISAGARIAEFPSLARRIARANPSMSKSEVLMAARKESYVPGAGAARLAKIAAKGKGKPGWKGGIPDRILTAKIEHEGEVFTETQVRARPPSRSAAGRALQGKYDRWSRSHGHLAPDRIPLVGKRFTELHRASVALTKGRVLESDKVRVGLLQQMAPIETYIRQAGLGNKVTNTLLNRVKENRARLSETFWGPQGPHKLDPQETLAAVAADLRDIAENGGLDIPSNKLIAIDKELRKANSRLESLGPTVHLGSGAWAKATNVMREAGYSQPQIETNLELASAVARAWAKREPGRNPDDWLESEEGRNIADFKYGTPDADKLSQSLFQVLYPDNEAIPMYDSNPARRNRKALRDQRAAHAAAVEAGEIAPDTPFVPAPEVNVPYQVGPQIAPSGKEVMSHGKRHTQAATEVWSVIDADGNPLRGADPETLAKVQANLPQEGRVETLPNGDVVWVGKTTLKQKSDRAEAFLDGLSPADRKLFSMWYERVWDYIGYVYGEDKMMQMGNAFWASQAAQSPVGGVANIFKIAQMISEGKKLPKDTKGFIEPNIYKLMTGADLGQNPTGLAAKLMDFFDAGYGMDMRTILSSLNERPGPGVVDRWTWRSDGYITPEKGGLAPAQLRRRVKDVESDKFLASPARSVYAYEYSSMRLQKMTDDWNRRGVGEKNDWTVEEVQAVDWFATKKHWVTHGFTDAGSEGGSPLDMILENTREVSFAGTPEELQRVVEETGGGVEILSGLSRDRKTIQHSIGPDGRTHAILTGDQPTLRKVSQKLGDAIYMSYPGGQGGTATKRSHQLTIPRHQEGDASEAAMRLGIKPGDKPRVISLGEDSVRLDFGNGTRALKRAEDIAGELGIPKDQIVARLTTVHGEGPRVLKQRLAQGVAGAVEFLDTDSGRQLLYLSEHANPTTFAHELFGHAAHEMRREFPDEFAAVEKRYGKKLKDWTETEHERMAREMERYLMTGKAPIDELQPIFTAMKQWMQTVYETIKALGPKRIPPETQRLFDRYFGKEPLDFTPPKRTPKRLVATAPGDVDAVDKIVDETADLLIRGAEVLTQDPKARSRIAGNMKWLEQQVLPFVGSQDAALAAKVHDLFNQYDEVKSGSSIFDPDQRVLLKARGDLLTMRHKQLESIADKLRSQPDHAALAAARNVMDAADEPNPTLEDVRDLVSDIGHVSHEIRMRTQGDFERQRWLNRTVDDIERALNPKRLDPKSKRGRKTKQQRDEAQGAMRDISEVMTGIYLDVFGENMTPVERADLADTLQARDDVIPTRLRELNLLDEDTGHGSYVPHYSVFEQLFNTIRGPVRLPAAGRSKKILTTKVRSDQMTFGKGPNKLVRYGTGELQVDPRALLSAFKQRMRFLETSALRKQLYDMAAPIPKDPVNGMPRIPEGWYVINGTGKGVPERLKRWQEASPKERDELLASGQDFDSMLQTEGGTVKMLEEYRDSWLTKKDDNHRIPSDWADDGLRMLPPDVVETMVGKVFEGAPGGFLGSLGGIVGTAGRVATIFSHPIGYMNANIAANGILLMLTNPTRAPRAVLEFFKAPGSLRAKHHALYETITSLTGDVQAGAGIPEFYVRAQTGMENIERAATSLTSKWAGTLGSVADQPFRVASWTGHARKYGFDDPEGWHLLAHSDDPEIVKVREIVSQRAREDMLDFNKLTAQEQRLTRLLFIYPFIRAAVAQPLWMMREYPARVTAMAGAANAQSAAYGEGDPLSMKEKYNAVAPAEERSMFDLSDIPFAGGTVNMNPVNPLGPFTEKFADLNTVLNDPKQAGRVAAGMINPAFAAFGQGSFGYGGMDWEKILGSTVPGASYVMAVTTAKKRGAAKYDDRSSWFDYVRRRDLRFLPESVDPEKIREKGKEEADKLDTRPAWEKAKEKDLDTIDKIFATGKKKTGREVDEKTKANVIRSVNAYNALDEAEDKMSDDLGIDQEDLTEMQRIEATEAVLLDYYPRDGPAYIMDREDVERLPDKARGGAASKNGYRQHLRDVIQYYRSAARKEGRDMGLEIE